MIDAPSCPKSLEYSAPAPGRSSIRSDRVGRAYTSITFPETVVLIVGLIEGGRTWSAGPMWMGVAIVSEALVEGVIIAFADKEMDEWYEEV